MLNCRRLVAPEGTSPLSGCLDGYRAGAPRVLRHKLGCAKGNLIPGAMGGISMVAPA